MGKSWSVRVRVAILVVTIVLISFLHYETATSHVWLHPLLQRAYYIPLLLMALWFGWRGGLAGAVLAGVLYIPHIVMAWNSNPEYRTAQYVEVVMFFVITPLVGFLADHEQMQRKKAEETGRKLSETYAELQSSFERLRRADRLSALGELSAGLAHEIRNPLGSVEGALQILGRSDATPEVRTEFKELAKKELDRLKGLLTNFLEFARPRPPQRMLIEPQLLLDDVARLAGETAKMSGVTIQVKSSGTIPSVLVDPDQIKQVLLNLVLNAVQATPEGGEIVLAANTHSGNVSLTVKDQGGGISPEDMEKVFDPFFTTRAGGTGLGLSIAYQIVNRHDGHISIGKNPDRGVTFSVTLPVVHNENTAEQDLQVKAR